MVLKKQPCDRRTKRHRLNIDTYDSQTDLHKGMGLEKQPCDRRTKRHRLKLNIDTYDSQTDLLKGMGLEKWFPCRPFYPLTIDLTIHRLDFEVSIIINH